MARGGRSHRRKAAASGENVSLIKQQPVPCIIAAATVNMPTEAEVLEAVESLYNDGLRPYSRILRKRLVEYAQDAQVDLLGRGNDGVEKDCDSSRLRGLCEESLQLRVEPEDWREWTALLVDRAPNFVDIYDPIDNYPQELWTAAEQYFKTLGESGDLALAGGRYASARALAQRRLPFLEGYCLGQICHITQLAISKRKLLGYFNGAIVPYEQSTSMLKCRCAQLQRPIAEPPVAVSPDGPLQFEVADWGTARQKLRQILDTAALRGVHQVPLSNVKRLFRSVFQMELSETALGHAKLSELLQDPRFSDMCSVQLQDRGYAVVPVYPLRAEPLHSDDVALGAGLQQFTPRRNELGKHVTLQTPMQTPKQVTPVQTPERRKVPPLMLTPSPPRTIRRSMSVPNDVGDRKRAADDQVNSLEPLVSHRSLDDSTCSTVRDRNDDSGACGSVPRLARMDSNISEGGLRGLTKMDSNLSESGWMSPHRGAGAELRAELQRRLSRSERCADV